MTPLQVVALMALVLGGGMAAFAGLGLVPSAVGHWGTVLVAVAVGLLAFAGVK